MNFNVNLPQKPSFKGIYVIEGKGKEVNEYIYMAKALFNLDEQNPSKAKNSINDFERLCITDLYGYEQPCAQVLITTNEDTQALRNWFGKYRAASVYYEVPTTSKERLQASKKLAKIFQEMDEYRATKNDPDKDLDFVLEAKKKAMTILEQMKEFTKKKIETFKFADAMQGIMDGTFSVAEGKIKL